MAFVRRTGAAPLALSDTPSRSEIPTEASGHHRGLPLSSSLRVGRRCRSLWITAMVVGSTTPVRAAQRTVSMDGETECPPVWHLAPASRGTPPRLLPSSAPTQQLAGSRVSTETRLTGNVPGPLDPASLLTLSLTFVASRPLHSSHLSPIAETRQTPCSPPALTGLGPTGHRCRLLSVSAAPIIAERHADVAPRPGV